MVCTALLPAPIVAGGEVVSALRHRRLLESLSKRASDLSLPELAQLACIFDNTSLQDNEFFTAAARHICECSSLGSRSFVATSPGDLAALVWILARYFLSPGGGEHPFEVVSAGRAICSVLPGLVPALSEADLARLIWGLGHLGEKPLGLIDELGAQAALRATKSLCSAREFARISWGLAVLGKRPPNVEWVASMAALAAASADAEGGSGRLEAPELAQLAAALGSWAVGGRANVQPLWTVLGRRIADFTGEELLMALTATVTLGIRDDVLVANAQARALVIGPFDAVGSQDFLRCLQNYAELFRSEHVRGLSAAYAAQVYRSAGMALTAPEFSKSFAPSAIARFDPFCGPPVV